MMLENVDMNLLRLLDCNSVYSVHEKPTMVNLRYLAAEDVP